MNAPVLGDDEYNDDRMFVAHIGRCTVKERADTIDTTIHHDASPPDAIWCVVTFRNTVRYPAFRVDHFNTEDEAQRYLEEILPLVPLVSLGGASPQPAKTYAEYRDWERRNGLMPFEPLRMFSPGGSNACDVIVQRKPTGDRDAAV